MKARERDVLRMARKVCPDAALQITKGGHLRVRLFGPRGSRFVIASYSPGDRRNELNLMRDLRAAAAELGIDPDAQE